MFLDRLRKLLVRRGFFLTFISAYTIFVFYPIVTALSQNRLVGGDVAEYLLSARLLLSGGSNIYHYPYPLLPALYAAILPLLGNPISAYNTGILLTGAMMVLMVTLAYTLLRKITHSESSSIAGAAIMGTYPLIMDEIGWGGQAQFLAFILGLVTFAIAVDFVKRPTLPRALLIAVLMLLAILSEPYAALFFMGSVVLALAFELRSSLLSRKMIIALLIIILLPLFGLVQSGPLRDPATGHILTDPLAFHLSDANMVTNLISRMTFGYSSLLLEYGIFIIIYFWSSREHTQSHLATSLLLSTFVATIVQALFLTPAKFADRGLYFLSIPLALVVCMAANSISVNSSRMKRIVGAVLAGTIISTVVLSSITYFPTVQFYSRNANTVFNLAWTSGESGSLVYLGTQNLVFPLAYATSHDVYENIQPVSFDLQRQVNAMEVATNLSWGIAWIDAGDMKVVDAMPVWAQPSPALYIGKYPYYVELFRLSDGLLPIDYSPGSNSSLIRQESPFFASSISTSYGNSSIAHAYSWNGFNLTKTISVNHGGVLDVTFRYQFYGAVPRQLQLRLISLMMPMNAAPITNDGGDSSMRLQWSFASPWLRNAYTVDVRVHSPNSTVRSAYVGKDQWGLAEIASTIQPPEKAGTILVGLEATVQGITTTNPRIVLEREVLDQWGIHWIAVDKAVHPDILQRLERDPNFRVYSNSTDLVVFEYVDFGLDVSRLSGGG